MNGQRNLAPQTSPSTYTPAGMPSVLQVPLGYYATSLQQIDLNLPKSFILYAQLMNISTKQDGSVFATISFATDGGNGKTIHQSMLIFPVITFIQQNSPAFFPTSNHVKTTVTKNSKETLSLLQTIKGKNILITFQTAKSNPNGNSQQNIYDNQCNNALLVTVATGSKQPDCLPFSNQIGIYENF